MGLFIRLQGRGGRTTRVGLYAALVSGLLAVADIALTALGGVGEASEETFSPTTFGAFLALIASLILLGIAHRKSTSLSPPWHSLPLTIGVLTIPFILIGAVLESLDPRLFELPIVVLGLAWVLLGYVTIVIHDEGSEPSQAPTMSRDLRTAITSPVVPIAIPYMD